MNEEHYLLNNSLGKAREHACCKWVKKKISTEHTPEYLPDTVYDSVEIQKLKNTSNNKILIQLLSTLYSLLALFLLFCHFVYYITIASQLGNQNWKTWKQLFTFEVCVLCIFKSLLYCNCFHIWAHHSHILLLHPLILWISFRRLLYSRNRSNWLQEKRLRAFSLPATKHLKNS